MDFNWKNLENNTIRRVLSWFGIGSSAFLFSACYGTPDDYYRTLAVFPDVLTLPSKAEKVDSLELYSEGDWQIIETPSFITVQPMQGSRSAVIYVTTSEANDQKQCRYGELVIGCEGMKVGALIRQLSSTEESEGNE